MKIINTLIIAAVSLGGTVCADKAQEMMLKDLEVIEQTFNVKYAPKEWKYEFSGWDLHEQMNIAKNKVKDSSNITLKDYQRIIRDFFNSTKDFHVGVSFYSTEFSVLPFRMESAEGRYFIAYALDSKHFAPYMNYELNKGDEVLAIDGIPVAQAIEQFKNDEFQGLTSPSDHAIAVTAFTTRMGNHGHLTPEGPITITVKHKGTKKIATYDLIWIHNPDEIPNILVTNTRALKEQSSFYKKEMTSAYFAKWKDTKALTKKILKKVEDQDDKFIGSVKSSLPPLGKEIWKSSFGSFFDAKIYQIRDKKIGFVRIPHYMGSAQDFQDFVQIIDHLEKNSDLLVIDQLNNPGGMVFFTYALASVLTDKPLYVPKQKISINQSDLFDASQERQGLEKITNDEEAIQEIGTSIVGYPVNHRLVQNFLSYSDFIAAEWKAGRAITENGYLYGIDLIYPHTTHYTKPIYILINELDFSGGDFFPAILQDNKRATVLGNGTGGAGGFVINHAFQNLFGIESFRLTGSLAERLNGKPIENLGVTPDVKIEVTSRDLQENYVDYTRNLLNVIK